MGNSPRSIRHLLLSAHYRKQLNFTLEGIKQSDQALARIDNLLLRLRHIKGGDDNPELDSIVKNLYDDFTEAVDNDLNISGGMGVFFEFVHLVNTLISEEKISENNASAIIEAIQNLDQVFGFIFMDDTSADVDEERIESLIQERLTAKKEKNYARADEIRVILDSEGIVLEDTKDGTRWKRKK
jgi:cysteinyl-tRNA synthetase